MRTRARSGPHPRPGSGGLRPSRRPSRRAAALLPPLLLAGLALPASGQQAASPSPPPPSDTVQAADSARARVLQLLERLAAPPLPDSLRELADSTERRPPPRAAEPDSVLEALLALPGYQASRYRGTELEFGPGEHVVLHGSSEARARFFREGAERMQLEADSAISMNDSTGLVWTRGASVFTGREGDPLSSTSMIYNLGDRRGTAYSARTRFSESGSPWIVSGDLPSVTPETVHGAHVGFTTCDLEHPHYRFDTSEIKIVAGNVLVARSVRLYFGDVPVFWFPFMFQSMERGRASGILTPRFSVNDVVRSSAGYSRRISNLGYYWAINEYADASVAMDWWADNYVGVTGTLSYNWLRQFLRGNVKFRNFWREDGSTTLALSTNHRWEIDERTQFDARGSYASSTDFVRQNSFDPREVTQSIDSQGGIRREFDWGNLSLSANRRQFLSDDRVSLTLPSANLSLKPITFLRATSSQARWFNDVVWTGSGNYTRNVEDRLDQPPGTFTEALADRLDTRAGLSSSLSLGAFSLSHNLNFDETVTRDGLALAPAAGLAAPDRLENWFGDVAAPARDSVSPQRADLSKAEIAWSQTVSYQHRLIGTTTLTPNLSMSGRAMRSNEIPEAGSLVSAPTRLSFGAGLKTDLYGLWPGVGGFSAIRHKLSPGFDYSYAPAATQTDLQNAVFGRSEFRARNEMRIRLNQTFEAKREIEGAEEEEGAAADAPPAPSGEPRRRERAEIVQLLALQTSAVNYDFVRADSLGRFTEGFTTTTLSNSVSSDFLRGLQISMDHLLFDEGAQGEGRKFSPHLSGLDLSFALSASSPPLRWLGGLIGVGSGTDGARPEEEEEDAAEDSFQPASGVDESSVVPDFGGASSNLRGGRAPGGRSSGRGWDANVSYSLQRPRERDDVRQMLQLNVRFQPTEMWRATWRTSYDVELGTFNDHMISFSRELHRWEANFDFRRTVTGNWAFRFEVALSDNRDLMFDYQQYDRSGSDPDRFRPR